ncbi:AraC family transcriptional regulator [Pseudomonas protegens]|uniref:AraC family transcriptional regulator n=1 Tax=Pseudomonas TaxID=286 RepID=UPI000D86AB9B|nr:MULTISPECIES: AraC family transcriptional regulator [Pseudomonas]MBS7560328.1 AraC family transcriptional regulator ligand-binding domain-containing protein [Pseudomonas sp. RC4D1]MDP9504456.1 AraC family transcriptional regulator ligand-binding domain-containing protein [Pseudomonas protegens]NMY70832.1 AraC family transcriptional regulator [Pseudomonas sp. WS 5414]PYB98620.1 AraC family transcriptional regulator [Pseudomonas protegens]UZE32736.1 AraC family transcriptional regulator [Pseu
MTVKTHWYEADTRFIPGHYQPAALIDLALSRDIDSHRLLRGTGLFHEDILAGQTRLSPQQFLALIGNSRRLLDADDSSFLFGQRLLPGHYGAASHALRHAQNLHQALDTLVQQQALLSPLLSPRLVLDEQHAYCYWLDSCGAGEHGRFLLEASMTSLVAMSQWLAGQRLPWECSFSHAEPRYVEQYWVHLGEQTQFQRPLDLMRIPREYLTRPWPGTSATAGQVARQEAAEHLRQLGFSTSFLDALYRYLQANVRSAPSLEQAAQAFVMSPATLKRKLSKHHSGYQQQVDRVRKHVALYLYQIKGWSNEAVAEYLNFNDPANFRRSFKRWTGSTPTLIRQLLGDS